MKRLIIIIIFMVLLVPISYVSAGDKETLDLAKDKTLMSNFLDPIEGQGQIIGFERMGAGNEIKIFLNKFKKEIVTTSSFSWTIIPDLKDGQPAGMIKFTYSF
jgi:hypothetical protein